MKNFILFFTLMFFLAGCSGTNVVDNREKPVHIAYDNVEVVCMNKQLQFKIKTNNGIVTYLPVEKIKEKDNNSPTYSYIPITCDF